jgi:hypothetical protein
VRRRVALALLLLFTGASSAAAPKPFAFSVFVATGLPLGDVVWTGEHFLYVAERTGEIAASGPAGEAFATFASLPPEYEETRCVSSPGNHGWPADIVYCHGPHGRIWRVAADGSVSDLVALPDTKLQDGALAFDTAGSFGYALLAASGGSASQGGPVYAVAPNGDTRRVGAYPGPGGAENVRLAPAGFGSAANQLLLAIDARNKGGRLLAMTPSGAVRVLVKLPQGINPIAVIGLGGAPRGAAAAGLYLTDTVTRDVYFLPAAQLTPYAGAVFVGGEKGLARLWIVEPTKHGFNAVPVHSNLEQHRNWNFEGAIDIP